MAGWRGWWRTTEPSTTSDRGPIPMRSPPTLTLPHRGEGKWCGMSDTILWYATRGAGVVTLVLLSGVVVLGIVSSMRWQTPAWPRFLTTGFHRNLSLTTLAFLAIHVVTAVAVASTVL